jgi:3D (Asp-Asp-Asp) domain-containing protein
VRRLKRIAFFLCLAALAPLWLSGWTSDVLSDARGSVDPTQAPACAQADDPTNESGRMFLAATGRASRPVALTAGDQDQRPEGIILPDPVVVAATEVTVVAPKPKVVKPPAPPKPKTRTLRMLVTAYCPCSKCCGSHSDGITACGKSIYANRSRFVAADTRLLPFGKKLSIPGYYSGVPVPVYDRGGKIKGRRLDVFFHSHWRARKWGARWLNVTVYD